MHLQHSSSRGWANILLLLIWLALISAGLYLVLRMERSREILPGLRIAPQGEGNAEIQLPNFSEN